ncbi:MAG: hypothetical protein OHK0046_09960 [Anaerolineae bacterium]
MKRILVFGLLLFCFLLVNGTLAQEGDVWTILHYTAVDNDLEGAAFNDYYEMQSVGSGAGVNIVAQLDRAEGYDLRFGDWTDTRRFYMEYVEPLPALDMDGKREALAVYFEEAGYGDIESLTAEIATLDDDTVNAIYENNNVGVSFDQEPVEELGEVDMGDPQALYDFIVWGVENFPAEHYMIVIGSHGGGWRGLGPDHGSGDSMLDLPEVSAALEQARADLGIEKFDIVGFDACLMGVVDVAVMLEPHADFVLFSQEVIPGNGWEYTNTIAAMQANPDWDAFQVGANVIDNYMAYYEGPGSRTKVGLSMVETALLPDLRAALENFSSVVGTESVELLSALGTARNNSQIFGASLGDRADFYSYVDLRDFMTWFSLQTTITEDAYNAALEVIAAYDAAVPYALADSKLPRATGLAIYLPSTALYYEAYGMDYPAAAPDDFAFWQDYLNQFYSTIAAELDGSALQLDITNVFTISGTGGTLDNPVVSFDAGGIGVVDLTYTVTYLEDDGSRIIVDTFPISYNTILPTGELAIEYPNELTPSTFTWNVEFPIISDGVNQVLGLLQASAGSGTEATIQGTYVSAEGSQPAVLVFDTDTLAYSGMLAIASEAPYEASPVPGDQFIVDLISITPEGEISVIPLEDSPLTFGVEPFTLSYEPADTGSYEIGLSMTDLAGNSIYQSTPVTIDNESSDGTLRGYTNINEGVYFQYPRVWGDSFSFTNEDGSETDAVGDDDGTFTLYVDAYFEAEPADALDAALAFVEVEGAEVFEFTLGGFAALGADYTLEGEDGTTYGTAISIFNDASNTSIVITLQASSDDVETYNAILSLVDSSLILFAPVE